MSVELEKNKEYMDTVKAVLMAVSLLSCFIMPVVTFFAWLQGSNNTTIYVVASISAWVILAYWAESPDKKKSEFHDSLVGNSQKDGDSKVETYNVDYLGGHPSTIVKSPLSGTISISPCRIGFIANYFPDLNFAINLDDITEISQETQESLSLGRFLMVGVLAFAFKKKQDYIRISFKNGIGEISTLVFESSKAGWVAQVINQKRYNFIANNKNIG